MQTYDVVMPILKRDWLAAQANLPFVFKNLPIKRLVVLSAPDIKELLPDDDRIVFVDENELFPGLTLAAVKKLMYSRIYTDKRAGWYFQQFLKMGYANICQDEAYVVWDADTVPVRKVGFVDEAGRYQFSLREEYNIRYFDTLRTLLGLEKVEKESFIVENMIFDVVLMRELLAKIEANTALDGTVFWEKIIYAVKEEDLKGSGFSEFETYGTYVMTLHPGRYSTRHLRTLRSGKNILGAQPSEEMLEWAGQSYDLVSMEKFSASTPLVRLASNPKYRAQHTAEQLDDLKNSFHVIPAVYCWCTRLWPRFKIWGGKYKRKLRAAMHK